MDDILISITALTFLLKSRVTCLHSVPVNFVSISMANLQSTYSPIIIEPTFQLALKEMSGKYPKLFRNYTWTTRSTTEESSCTIGGREQTVNYMASLYHGGLFDSRKGQTVILAPLPCPGSLYQIADMARELNVLMSTCAVSDVAYVEPARFPTVLSFSRVDLSKYYGTLTALLQYFQWRTISFLNDQLSDYSNATASTEACRAALVHLRTALPSVNAIEFRTDSAFGSWNESLKNASDHSRIILCCTFPKPLRALMLTASSMNMTKGDHVFLSFFPLMAWIRHDGFDETIKQALNSLLIIQTGLTNWTVLDHLFDTLIHSQPNPQPFFAPFVNTTLLDCVESVEVIAQVLNESLRDSPGQVVSGIKLAEKFHSRTFSASLTDTSVSLTIRGTRRTFLEILQYQPDTNEFQPVFMYDSGTGTLTESQEFPVKWLLNKVPLDHPDCMDTSQCVTQRKLVTSVLAGTITPLLILIGIVWLIVWLRPKPSTNNWWHLDGLSMEVVSQRPLRWTESHGSHSRSSTRNKRMERFRYI